MCAGLVGQKSENIKNSLAWVRPKWACKQQARIFAANFASPKGGPGTTRKGTEETKER